MWADADGRDAAIVEIFEVAHMQGAVRRSGASQNVGTGGTDVGDGRQSQEAEHPGKHQSSCPIHVLPRLWLGQLAESEYYCIRVSGAAFDLKI